MVVLCRNRTIADKVKNADSFFSRLKGLIGKKELLAGEGLLLKNCPSVHCFFMKIPIDVVYLSRGFTVLHVETLKPWRIGSRVKKTAHILELPANSVCINIGDVLTIFE
jgi:uncharacterized membrane protein (UPF0127 family)